MSGDYTRLETDFYYWIVNHARNQINHLEKSVFYM